MPTLRKKQPIEVRLYGPGQTRHGSESRIGRITGDLGHYQVIARIKRVLRAEQIGNFNPVFVTYQGKQYLVQSEAGDLSDPFRREESYLLKLFIEAPPLHIRRQAVIGSETIESNPEFRTAAAG